jgi:CRP/FNR family transcriptional regulator
LSGFEKSSAFMNIEFILAQTTFFRDLGAESRRALAEIACPRAVRRREVLFREGEEGHALYLLNRGRLQLVKHGLDDADVVIMTVRPGQTFAEVVLFERSRYPVTAVALADSTVFLFPRRDFRALLRREDFRDDFISMLMRRQRYLAARIVEQSAADAETRLLHFLDEQFGPGPRVEVDLTKKAAAAAIGVAPETLSRLLKRLEKSGRLVWRGKTLIRRI